MARPAGTKALCVILSLAACDSPEEPRNLARVSAPATSVLALAPSGSTSVVDEGVSPHAGTWTGDFDAKKADVTVQEGVRYPVWKDEPGEQALGKGTLTIVVDRSGRVTGHASGSLGEMLVNGMLEEAEPPNKTAVLNARLSPRNRGEGHAMGGLVVARSVGAGGVRSIEGTLRVSNHDGTIARRATIKLHRDKHPP